MDAAHLNEELDGHGLSAIGFARLLKELGDPATLPAIERRVRRWTNGEASVSGEAVAFLTMLKRVRTASIEIAGLLSQLQKKKKRRVRKPPT